MIDLNTYITEKLKINKDTVKHKYNYHPKDKDELRSLIEQLLKERGKDADLNDIDTSEITSMSFLFFNLDPRNINISKWDVSNVEHMNSMFDECEKFNSDLSDWDVSNVIDMKEMFFHCKKFNSDLNNWNVKKAKYRKDMLYGCDSLKKIPDWYSWLI